MLKNILERETSQLLRLQHRFGFSFGIFDSKYGHRGRIIRILETRKTISINNSYGTFQSEFRRSKGFFSKFEYAAKKKKMLGNKQK